MNVHDEQIRYWEQEHNFRSYDHPVVRFFAEQRIHFINQYIDLKQVESALVVIFEPNRYNPAQAALAVVEKEHRWILRYSSSYLKKLVKSAGLEVYQCAVVGCTFPNRTPLFALNIVKYLPFRIPLLGVSNVLICKKNVLRK